MYLKVKRRDILKIRVRQGAEVMRRAKQVLREMLVGLGAWVVLVALVLLVISKNKLAVVFGTVAGGAAAALVIMHMYRHIDIALDMEPDQARKHIQFSAVQRLFIMAALLAVSMMAYKYIHPVGTVLGLFGIKISAYLQPLVHRITG